MSKRKPYLVTCSVQSRRDWAGQEKALQAVMRAIYRDLIDPGAKIRFIWIEMPPGRSWLAGAPTAHSTVLAPVPDDLAGARRHDFMKAICDRWQDVTGCSVNEIIVVAQDRSRHEDYAALSRARFGEAGFRRLVAKLLPRLVWSRLRRGFVALQTVLP